MLLSAERRTRVTSTKAWRSRERKGGNGFIDQGQRLPTWRKHSRPTASPLSAFGKRGYAFKLGVIGASGIVRMALGGSRANEGLTLHPTNVDISVLMNRWVFLMNFSPPPPSTVCICTFKLMVL